MNAKSMAIVISLYFEISVGFYLREIGEI